MNKVLIIAEAGVNHNGDINLAKKLVDAAAHAGVDLVKFQTFKADTLVSKKAKKAAYQIENMADNKDDSQYAMLKKLELSEEQHEELITYCQQIGIGFFSTAFDVEGLRYLKNLGLKHFKVPSGEITNYPYLKLIAGFGLPVILSTGMANLDEVQEALNVLTSEGLRRDDITVLHCNTQYPTPMADVNLLAMKEIAEKAKVSIGYSDHTLGIEVPIAAVALGARVIEKHFTLDRNLPGPDHKASLEPDELNAMVNAIRNIEAAISGDGKKRPSKSEEPNIAVVRKSIHYNRNLSAGEVLKSEDLTTLRPGSGLSPMRWVEVVGKCLKTDVDKGEMLNLNHLES